MQLPAYRRVLIIVNSAIMLILLMMLVTAEERTTGGILLAIGIITLVAIPIGISFLQLDPDRRILAYWISALLMTPFAVTGMATSWGFLLLVAMGVTLLAARMEREG